MKNNRKEKTQEEIEQEADREAEKLLEGYDPTADTQEESDSEDEKEPEEDDSEDTANIEDALDAALDSEPVKKKGEDGSVGFKETESAEVNIQDITIPKKLLRIFPEDEINELAASIKRDKLLQPIIISTDGELVAGHRRFLAHKKLGLHKIKAVIREVENEDRYRISLIENLQRKQLSTEELGKAYWELLKDKQRFRTQKALAKALGITEAKLSLTLKAAGLGETYAGVVEKKKAAMKAAPKPKAYPFEEGNLPRGVTAMVYPHEVCIAFKLKIESEKHAKHFDINEEISKVMEKISAEEFCAELKILLDKHR